MAADRRLGLGARAAAMHCDVIALGGEPQGERSADPHGGARHERRSAVPAMLLSVLD